MSVLDGNNPFFALSPELIETAAAWYSEALVASGRPLNRLIDLNRGVLAIQ